MIVTPIRTHKIRAGETSLTDILDAYIPALADASVVVITSKIVSLCENNVVTASDTNWQQLVRNQADLYFVAKPQDLRPYNFTIKQHTLIPASGIDVSNSDGRYVLWPEDANSSARAARDHLATRHHLTRLGVIITDSTIGLSRWGTLGIAIGHSGFRPVKSYIGQPDLFGNTLAVSRANIAGGLASAAVLEMGEGNEQTPLAVIASANSVEFLDPATGQDHADEYYVSPLDDDPFAPFFASADWRSGGGA